MQNIKELWVVVVLLGSTMSYAIAADTMPSLKENSWIPIVDRLISENKMDNAIKILTTTINKTPTNLTAIKYRGLVHLFKGNHQQAIADFTTLLQTQQNNVEILSKRAGCYQSLGKYSNAISDYSQLIALQPDNFQWYFSRGRAFYSSGEYDPSLEDFDHVLRLNPDCNLASDYLELIHKKLFNLD